MHTITTAALFTATLVSTARAGEPANSLENAPSRFSKLDAIRVHYKTLGEGKTAVVFVHGFAADMNTWHFQVPAFADKARVVLIDLPGYGKSDKPKVDYTMSLFADAVNAVLADIGAERAVLVGHSMGTGVVRQFWRRYPDKTVALVAVDGLIAPRRPRRGWPTWTGRRPRR
jgi:pimeloyl-ACP methyl ester carboxylesterase